MSSARQGTCSLNGMVGQSRPTLAEFTAPELLFPALDVKSASDAIRILCNALESTGRVSSAIDLYHAVLNREMLGGGTVMDGWALPHGRVADGATLCFGLCKPARPLRWFDGSLAELVFMCAVPQSESEEYLHLIGGIARLSNDAAASRALLKATSAKAMFEILAQAKVRSVAGSTALPH